MNELANRIAGEIRDQGPMTFARFMELALYCPNYGYYQKEGDIIGRHGDFYTSASVGPLFGELLAFRFVEWLREHELVGNDGASTLPRGGLRIVEAGADRGDLARDILSWLRAHQPALFNGLQYDIIEPLDGRRRLQRQNLGELATAVRWAGDMAEIAPHQLRGADGTRRGIRGIIFSNELLDSMPVHRLGWDAQRRRWFEWGVAIDGERFVWTRMPLPEVASDGDPAAHLRRLFASPDGGLLASLPDGYTTEWSPAAEEWWRRAASVLDMGKLVTIDYGLSVEELSAPERAAGTLRTYRRHHVGSDVLSHPGEMDITAHVNLTAIQAAGESMGLRTEVYQTQAQFLTGIMGRFHAAGFGRDWPGKRAREFQTLTHPEHLGRAFRVLAQSRR